MLPVHGLHVVRQTAQLRTPNFNAVCHDATLCQPLAYSPHGPTTTIITYIPGVLKAQAPINWGCVAITRGATPLQRRRSACSGLLQAGTYAAVAASSWLQAAEPFRQHCHRQHLRQQHMNVLCATSPTLGLPRPRSPPSLHPIPPTTTRTQGTSGVDAAGWHAAC